MSADETMNEQLRVLQKRVQLLEDKEAIQSLLSRYSIIIDAKRMDDVLKLWTDDCIFASDVSGKMVVIKGKKELGKMFAKPPPKSQHIQLDYVVNVDGDEARATGYQLMPSFQEDKITIGRSSLRVFRFRRINGTWFISEASSTNITNETACRELLPGDF